MRWEDLTSDDFAQAVRRCEGVCLLPLSVIERHGPHLPLGTDMFEGQGVCERAAVLEEAVVFPPFYFGQIMEAKCFSGTIALPGKLLLELLQTVCDEIGRNGFTKIIGYIAHGGNHHLVRYLMQCQLESPRNYHLYVINFTGGMNPQQLQAAHELVPTGMSHACEGETSLVLALRPELVKMQNVHSDSPPRKRLAALGKGSNALSWYADYPEHYAGDARPATAEKGKKLLELESQALATFIGAVKKDDVTGKLSEEFWRREDGLRNG